MSVSDMFKQFIDNLAIDNRRQIADRYGKITKALNLKYRNSESETANTLQVGSYGRYTAIKNISDLDMIYMLPSNQWEKFKDGKQSALLQEIKNTLKDIGHFSRTEMWGDGQVVVISFTNHDIEVLPAFEQSDGSFKYPDTNNGGSWPITKPRLEITAVSDMDKAKNGNLRPLCKMIRAWKNKHGVAMSGMLIDTLAYNFLNSTTEFDDKSYTYYDWMVRDFFLYASNQPNQDYYLAPGSRQHVKVKKKFQKKAKKAYDLSLEAIAAENLQSVNTKWKKIFGRPFPSAVSTVAEDSVTKAAQSWKNTEEFIEDKYPVDIRYNLEIDCEITQNGFRENTLANMLLRGIRLSPNKQLVFKVEKIDVAEPYEVFWKVLNVGETARQRDQIRGQIIRDMGKQQKDESTLFRGEHIVECYVVKNNVVVARDTIEVPIQ